MNSEICFDNFNTIHVDKNCMHYKVHVLHLFINNTNLCFCKKFPFEVVRECPNCAYPSQKNQHLHFNDGLHINRIDADLEIL